MQFQVRPDRAEDTDRHRDEKDETPFDWCKHAAEQETEERSPDRGDAVDAEREPSLVGRECVGDDGVRVGEEERAPNALTHSHEDDPHGARRAGHPRGGEQDGEHGEDRETERVHPHAPEDVTYTAETDHEHRSDEQEAGEDPQEVGRVALRERIQLDAAKDVRQGNQQDRTVDRRHEDAECRVGEGNPFVTVWMRMRGHEVS